MKLPPKRPNTVIHNGREKPAGLMECLTCGATEQVRFPIPTAAFVAKIDAFNRAHAHPSV